MAVRVIDSGGFLVTSESGEKEDNHEIIEYLVRIDEPKFPLGCCSCHDFKIRIKAALDAGATPPRLQCKHVSAVWSGIYARLHGLAT